jgi:arabinose-5-phosphate isomerase
VTRDQLVAAGRRVLRLEADAILAIDGALGAEFARAVELLRDCTGRVIVSGLGKSGLIARKIAATLTSTGTPAMWLHPVDSLHGDLGLVGPRDVAIVLSKSGETEELVGLVSELARLETPIIALTGGKESTLARAAAVVLDAGVEEEACPHDLAPTASTTVALALGDALAVALLEEKGFARDDFARLHPGGRLGKRLLLRVNEVMLAPGALLPSTATMREAVVELAHRRGLAMVGSNGRLGGVLTAGDLSRLADRHPDFLSRGVAAEMTTSPKICAPGDLAAAVVGRMERHGIVAMPVVDAGGHVVGVVHLHDLMRAGAV